MLLVKAPMLKTSDMWLQPGDLQSIVRYIDHLIGQHDRQQTGALLEIKYDKKSD